jgi:hypothetical protein
LKRHVIARLDPHANAGSGQRIGGSPAGKIGGKKHRPADAVVDEVRGGLALEKLAVRRHQTGAHGQAVIEGILLIPKRVEPRDRSGFQIGHRQEVAEVSRTEKRAVGDERVGVKVAAVPSGELAQIEFERRLKCAEADGATSDPAMDIGEKIVGVVEGECDAAGLEGGPQTAPITAQCRSGPEIVRWRLRPRRRADVGRAIREKGSRHGNGPRHETSDRCPHEPRPRSEAKPSFNQE